MSKIFLVIKNYKSILAKDGRAVEGVAQCA